MTRQQDGRQDKTRLKKNPPPKKKRQGLRARAFCGCISGGGGLKRRQKTNKTKEQQDKRATRQ